MFAIFSEFVNRVRLPNDSEVKTNPVVEMTQHLISCVKGRPFHHLSQSWDSQADTAISCGGQRTA